MPAIFTPNPCTVEPLPDIPDVSLVADDTVPPAPDPVIECDIRDLPALPPLPFCSPISNAIVHVTTLGPGTTPNAALVFSTTDDGSCRLIPHLTLQLPVGRCSSFSEGALTFNTVAPNGTPNLTIGFTAGVDPSACGFTVNPVLTLPRYVRTISTGDVSIEMLECDEEPTFNLEFVELTPGNIVANAEVGVPKCGDDGFWAKVTQESLEWDGSEPGQEGNGLTADWNRHHSWIEQRPIAGGDWEDLPAGRKGRSSGDALDPDPDWLEFNPAFEANDLPTPDYSVVWLRKGAAWTQEIATPTELEPELTTIVNVQDWRFSYEGGIPVSSGTAAASTCFKIGCTDGSAFLEPWPCPTTTTTTTTTPEP